MCLHGANGSARWWEDVCAALPLPSPTIRVDALGHGGSERPRSGYGIDAQANRVAAALAVLRVGRAVVCAHSTGGTIALALAARHRALVDALVIVGTAPAARWFRRRPAARASVIPVVGRAIRRFAPEPTLRRAVAAGFAPGFAVPAWAVQDLRRADFRAIVQTRRAQLRYLAEQSLSERLAAARLPALVIFGDRDRIVDSRAVEQWAPVAQVRMISGAGHSPNVERPLETAMLLAAFLRGGPAH